MTFTHWNEQDVLGRGALAQDLTNYLLARYESAREAEAPTPQMVLNLDAPWGSGKTYFLHGWNEALKKKGYTSVYFDAWASDYSNQPLLSLTSTLIEDIRSQLPTGSHRTTLTKILESGAKASVPPLAGWLAGLVTSGVASEPVKKVMETLLNEPHHRVLDDHREKSRALNELKQLLQDLVSSFEKDGEAGRCPIFVFVDELDRCRPSYAIEIIESIKHVFDVRGVFFIVATHSEQLAHSVRAIYGEGFDAPGYLDRFFHRRITLPDPNPSTYANELFLRNTMPEYAEDIFFPGISGDSLRSGERSLVSVFAIFAQRFALSLREQDYVAEELTACIWLLRQKEKIVHFGLLLLLLCLKVKPEHRKTYERALHGSWSIQSLPAESDFSHYELDQFGSKKPIYFSIRDLTEVYSRLLSADDLGDVRYQGWRYSVIARVSRDSKKGAQVNPKLELRYLMEVVRCASFV